MLPAYTYATIPAPFTHTEDGGNMDLQTLVPYYIIRWHHNTKDHDLCLCVHSSVSLSVYPNYDFQQFMKVM